MPSDLSPDLGPDLGPDGGPDLVGEPWKDYRDLDDDDWAALKLFLPETMGEDRALISGVLWVFTTRGVWKDMPAHFGNFNTARGRVTKLRSMDLWEPFIAKAKELGYALTRGEYVDNERRDDPAILRDGDGPGEQAWIGGAGEGGLGEGDEGDPDPPVKCPQKPEQLGKKPAG